MELFSKQKVIFDNTFSLIILVCRTKKKKEDHLDIKKKQNPVNHLLVLPDKNTTLSFFIF